ncbi:aspartate aminotransferase family protein [Rhodospirillum centenum]|uniref:Aminotransferase, class III n=1 Tax=Rhodospirillum centenum (strain ATCC 51521 / SW) TaxID=414684 RepID=B6IMW8_RHOCS|nr:aspartate aminotransferase family protein [Rhodospirillum centenum]ACI98865.1 aminotransferase, class III [Rhodospirillum centenum SW]
MDTHSPLGPDALKALDGRHHLHPFTDTKALAAEGGARLIVRGEGVWLTDADGQRILDGMAGLWCVNVGYGRAELAEAAHRQLLDLSFYHGFFKTTTEPVARLAGKLAELAPPGLSRAFFANSGSEANDTIVRMVRHYWNLKGRPGKKAFISRTHGYHGTTMASTSLGGIGVMHGQGDLPLPGFHHVMPPYAFDLARGLDPEAFGRLAARAVEEKILELGPENVAAFIGEPIQGAGGVIIPPDSYWPEINRICREHDILLIADEVICGFGRLGHWFGSQRYGIEPDFMTLAKGITSGYLPLSAVMVGDRVAETLIEEGGEFYHGFTYSGHPVPCAVALANIDLIERETLVERVRTDIGPYLRRRFEEALEGHPLVGEIRSEGLIGAIEIVKDRRTRERWPGDGKVGLMARDHCFRNNVIMRGIRDSLVFAPPLTLSHAEADEMVARARLSLDQTARDLGAL